MGSNKKTRNLKLINSVATVPDAISSLPDDVLAHILSFLSTKQAASTSVLSKRWRNVFILVFYLDLDYENRRDNPRNFIDFVEKLLNLQGNSPIKKLTLKSHVGVQAGVELTRVQSWISNVLKRGVMDLDLFITLKRNSQPVPLLIFKSETLVKLRLGRGFAINLSQDVSLPKLKTLCLNSVYFDGDHDILETLVPRCPVLEELVVEELRWLQWCGTVSSPSLKRLCIRSFNIPSISLDVPNLVYFELSCIFGSKYANVKLDSLVEARLNLWVDGNQIRGLRHGSHLIIADTIGLIVGIRNVRVLHLSSDTLELFYFSGHELPMFDNLVCLSIESDENRGWQLLPLLIKNSPNLETLIFKGLNHYKTKNCGDACVCYDFEENVSSCLSSSRVKVLEIRDYQGNTKELNQMKRFLKKLPCLELVKIRAINNLQVPIDTQHLLTLPRASSNCKIQVI